VSGAGALAERGALAPRPVPARGVPSSPAYHRFTAALASGRFSAARYHPLQLAKAAVAAWLADRLGFTANEAAWLVEARSAKAAQLRKPIAAMFDAASEPTRAATGCSRPASIPAGRTSFATALGA